jgi:hypothetical protein
MQVQSVKNQQNFNGRVLVFQHAGKYQSKKLNRIAQSLNKTELVKNSKLNTFLRPTKDGTVEITVSKSYIPNQRFKTNVCGYYAYDIEQKAYNHLAATNKKISLAESLAAKRANEQQLAKKIAENKIQKDKVSDRIEAESKNLRPETTTFYEDIKQKRSLKSVINDCLTAIKFFFRR